MKLRLALILLLVISVFVLVPYMIVVCMRPAMPPDLYRLFPASCEMGFVVDIKELLPSLPAEIRDKLSPRLSAFATSSSVQYATTADMSESYLIMKDAGNFEDVARMIDSNYTETSIGGMDVAQFEGGCLININEKDCFAVFGKDPIKLASARVHNYRKEPYLSSNLAKRFKESNEGTVFKAFGYPCEDTPILISDDYLFDLQNETEFFTLMIERKSEGLYGKLILYFYDITSRDLELIKLPTMLSNYKRLYPNITPIINGVVFKGGKKNSLQFEVLLTTKQIEAYLGVLVPDVEEDDPKVERTPLIPDIPEIPDIRF